MGTGLGNICLAEISLLQFGMCLSLNRRRNLEEFKDSINGCLHVAGPRDKYGSGSSFALLCFSGWFRTV